MENENIENEVVDNEIVENEVVEDVTEDTTVEDVSIDDVSEIENVPEKIILEDSEVENIQEEEPEQDLEELLRNYFSNSSDSGVENNTEAVEGSNEGSPAEYENELDYTLVLNDILSNTADSKQIISDTYDNILEVQQIRNIQK